MKKIKTIALFLIMLLLGVSIFGCIITDDYEISDNNMKKLISAMGSGNRDSVRALFASNKIADIEGFDDSVDELIAYYEGDFVSMRGGPGGVYDSKDGSIKIETHNMYYTVETTLHVYDVSIEWCVEYTKNSDKVGIWSLNITKKLEVEPKGGYGDSVFAPGIYIGILHPSEVLYQLFEAIDNQDHEGIKALFAPNAIANLESFDESVEALIGYYNRVEGPSFDNARIDKEGEYRDTIYYKMAFDVFDEFHALRYYVAAEWHLSDSEDENNVGLWSFSILKFGEGHDSVGTYRGDGQYTPGIHVAMPNTAIETE